MSKVIVKLEKCVGCNSCVRVCPVGDANRIIKDENGVLTIEIDTDKCIKCGACVKACGHGARAFEDDTDKTELERNFDCHACGFKSCKEMAVAIARGLNMPENCHQYTTAKMEEERQQIAAANAQVREITLDLQTVVKNLNKHIGEVQAEAENIGASGRSSGEEMNRVITYMI